MPDQPGPKPHLAVAAGKEGKMFLLDRDDPGGFTPGGPNRVLGTYDIGPCWCGPSYFVVADGNARIVSSGGSQLIIWKLQTTPSPSLVQEHVSSFANGQDGGFFTTVSSNGHASNTAIIWAVSRPNDSTHPEVSLGAFDPVTGAQIFSAPSGVWGDYDSNANISPVVSNGRVYVASDRQLAIFGLGSRLVTIPHVGILPALSRERAGRVVGEVKSADGARLTLTTPDGAEVQIDASKAFENKMSVPIVIGSPVMVRGEKDANGIVHAEAIAHAKPLSGYR
jgi:hypothetical protein